MVEVTEQQIGLATLNKPVQSQRALEWSINLPTLDTEI